MSLWAAVNIGDQYQFQGGAKATDSFGSVGDLISKWLPNVYIVAGIILFFYIILGGVAIISSAGNQEKIQEGQKKLTSAVVGFVILFASYWIIQIIQVMTGVPILKSGL